jgi:hypothetical protein
MRSLTWFSSHPTRVVSEILLPFWNCINIYGWNYSEGPAHLKIYQFLALFWSLFQAKFFKIGLPIKLYSYPIIVYSMSNFSEFRQNRKNRSFSNYFRKIEITWSNLVYCLSSKCRRRLLFPSWLMHLTTWQLYTGLPEIYLDNFEKKREIINLIGVRFPQ